MPRPTSLLLLGHLVLYFNGGLGQESYGTPLQSCPESGSDGSTGFFYIGDSLNTCVVWLCFNGEMVGETPFKCPEGMGIEPGVDGTSFNPCKPLTECGGMATTTTEVPTTIDPQGSLAEIYRVEPGSYVSNGHLQNGVRDFHTCFYTCIRNAACRAFDFDALRSVCYFHAESTACLSTKSRPFSVHVRVSQCDAADFTIAELSNMLSNYHIRGAVEQSAITGFTLCLLECVRAATCRGFEVDTRSGTCYFHDATTVCNQPTPTLFRSLYRLDRCLASGTDAPVETTTGSTASTSTTDQAQTQPTTTVLDPITGIPPFSQVIRGYHLFYGVFQRGIRNEEQCILACWTSNGCEGLDWDTRFSSCWFHTLDRECQELSPSPGVVHHRLTEQCGPIRTVAPITVPTTTPTQATTPTTTTTTTLPPIPPPPGYVSVSPGMNAQNARRTLVEATEQQCLDICLMTSFCLAVDYNRAEATCWMHGIGSYCNELDPCENCTHFARVPCIDGLYNDVVEVNHMFHALDGEEMCVNCDLDSCLATCFNDTSCYGIDYDSRAGGSCYRHGNDSICQALRPKDYCTHYSRMPCTLALSDTQPVPFQAPTGDFLELNFMGPTSLPSGWQAYPGMRIDEGVLIGGPGMTGDSCIAACVSANTCFAVDFDSETGMCYSLNTADNKCADLLPANQYYHAKKPPVCDFVTGTTESYPQPIAVAP